MLYKKMEKKYSKFEESFYNDLTKPRAKGKIKEIDELCIKHWNKSFKDIVLLSPKDIQDFVRDFDKLSKTERCNIRADFSQVGKGKKPYIISSLYENMPDSCEEKIFQMSKSRVCLYCASVV